MMNKYWTSLFLASSLALTGCGKKDDQSNSPATPDRTSQESRPANTNTDLPAPVIAAIDVQKILDNSKATTEIRQEIDKKRAQIQQEMTKYENELRDKDQKLAQDSKKLSEPEMKKRREAFEKVVADVQLKLNVRKVQLESAFEDARSKVYESFLKVSEDVRKNMGANIVLYKEQIVLADHAFDITDQVLDKLNKDLPNVKITYKSEDEILKLIKSKS